MIQAEELIIYIDGASKGNPGEAAIGVIIKNTQHKVLRRISERMDIATNNTAEYYALIYALQEALMMQAKILNVYSDSLLLINQVKGIFKVKNSNLKNLHSQILHLLKGFKKIRLQHIKREENKEADKLANLAFNPASANLE